LSILKKDEPIACAKYIKTYIVEPRRGARPLNDWTVSTLKQYGSTPLKTMTLIPYSFDKL